MKLVRKKSGFMSGGMYFIIMCMIVAWFAVFPVPVSKAASSYYVSTTGNDTTGNGTIGNPWRTIQKAASVMIAGDICYIRGGTYRETVTPANSGTANNPITFMPYNGEAVIVSGNDTVSGSWTHAGGSIYYTSVTMSLGDENQVFVDGNMGDLARWPNNTDGDVMTFDGAAVDSGSSTNIYDASLPNQSTDWYEGGIVVSQSQNVWGIWGTSITGSGGGNIYFDTLYGNIPLYMNPGTVESGAGPNQYYIAGLLGLLDTSMEWYYDSSAGRLYLRVPGGGSPAATTVEFKKRKLAFDLTSRSYIQIKDLSMKAAAITTTGSHNAIDGVTASYLSQHSGKGMWWGSPVSTGFQIGGSYNTIKNSTLSYSSGNGIHLTGSNHVVDNNTISHMNYMGGMSEAAILAGDGTGGNVISRNTVSQCGRSCFDANNMGFTSGYTIIYNDMSDGMKLTDDGGVIYMYGDDPGNGDFKNTVISYNKIHDSYSNISRNLASGIYLDDGSKNVEVHHNVIYNTQDTAIHFGNNHSGLKLYNITTYNTPSTMVKNRGGSYTSGNLYHNAASNKFVNAAAGDFRLAGTATDAIDAGTVASAYTVGYAGSNPDKGAYEHSGWDGVANWTSGVGSTLHFSNGWPTGGSTPSSLITNLTVYDTANAADWSALANIQTGDVAYGDRSYTFTSVPSVAAGSDWIKTANDSKAYTGATAVSFTLTAAADVYVAHDDAVTVKPSWMSGWTDTGDNLTSSSGSILSLYKKSYAAGSVSLGDNGQTSGCSFYIVLAKATSTPTPLITGMTVHDTTNAADWSIRSNIQSGDTEYGDRAFTLTSVPSVVAGSDWIRTANDSKAYTGATAVSFTLTAAADVYVAHDDRITTKPSWMTGWTDTGEHVTSSDGGVTFSLYKKSYSVGSVSLGSNGQTSGCSMYTILAIPH